MRASMLSSRWLTLAFVLVLLASGCTMVTSQESPPSSESSGAAISPSPSVIEAASATPVPAMDTPVAEASTTASPADQETPVSSESSAPVVSPTPVMTETVSATPTAAMESSEIAAANADEPAVAEQGVLYRDDFTNLESGWKDNLEFGSYYIGYHEPNHYHVEVHTPYDRALVAVPQQGFGDFTVESQALAEPNNTATTGDFRYGLFFRRTGNQYYAFTVSPRTKTWHVLKSSPTGLTELETGSSDSIHDVSGVDTLRVGVRGSTFLFYINDQTVGQVSDSDYTSGEVGFYVETLDSPRVHIHYDTITVRQIEAAPPASRVLYQDDFSNLESGWKDNLEFGSYYIGYHEPNHYHVEVHTPYDRALVAAPQQGFGDFTVESQALAEPNNTATTGDFRYGLFFRRAGNQYYAFAVSPRTKTWHVLKSSPTGLTELETGSSDSIHDVSLVDSLRVDVKGSTFFFHINNQTVGQVSDSDYASGEVGFYVETLDSPRVHIHYDSITVRDVDAPQPLCTVSTPALRLRVGPNTGSEVITSLSGGVRFEPLARSPDGFWIEVRPDGSDRTGWVASSPELVACNVPVESLPVAR